MTTSIRLALDWTPNTNHTGFYVALAQGWYEAAGLDVQISTPEDDRYHTTPAKRVVQGTADLAITPSESVISYQTNGVPLVAVAAVLARDASAIATLKQNGLDRPQHLDGKVYASYGARFEDDIVRQMIRNDGGRGQFVSYKPDRLDIWHTLLTNEADATWIFLPWEGAEAAIRDIPLHTFTLDEYEIPYGYSPVLTAMRPWADSHADALHRFLAATSDGFRLAVEQPEEAARLLAETAQHPTLADRDFVEQSQLLASDYYLNGGRWGYMRRDVWNTFVNWLIRHDFIINRDGDKVQQLNVDTLFTNQFLEGTPAPAH